MGKRVAKKARSPRVKKKAAQRPPKIIVDHTQIYDGDMVLIPRNGKQVAICCGCGMAHTFKWSMVREKKDYRIMYQVHMNNEVTEQNRKDERYPCKPR